MRNSYRLLLLAGLVIAVMAIGCHDKEGALVGAAGTVDDPNPYPIWATDGKNQIEVGRLEVWEDWDAGPASLHVKYVLTEPNWYLTECQLAVAVELESIPQRNGNPNTRDFEWTSGALGDATGYEFVVPFGTGWDVDNVLHVAAYCKLVQVAGHRRQKEIGWSGTEPFPGRKWALYCLYRIEGETPGGSGFRTVAQGAWGTPPEDDNWGQYLALHFGEVFDPLLRVGCGKYLLLTSPPAVETYLADCGLPTKLSKTCRDPSYNLSVFAGQVVALTINVKFDSAFADFAPSDNHLQNLYVADPASTFYGWTVQQVLDEANKVLGGYGSYPADEMNVCVTKINENHEDLGDGDFLSVLSP
jgi:hypothetical protein